MNFEQRIVAKSEKIGKIFDTITYCSYISKISGVGVTVKKYFNLLHNPGYFSRPADYVAACLADWSVVYVFVTLCMAVVMTGLVVWGSAHLIATKFGDNARPRRKPPRYSPLDGHDESIKRKYDVETFKNNHEPANNSN